MKNAAMTADSANAKVLNMTEEKYKLKHRGAEQSSSKGSQKATASALARRPAAAQTWLCFFWNSYSKEAHIGITQMYVDDPRFTEYYEKIAPGAAVFLRDAVAIYCK